MKGPKKRLPRPLRRVLFYLVQWTWGLPQNLVGALLLPFLPGKHVFRHGALITIYRQLKFTKNRSGFSLGMFIYIPETWNDHDRDHLSVHEFGHSIQSLLLGPFYLLVVGLPSVIWSTRYSRNYKEYRQLGINYTDRFPENEADRLGERATGKKPY